MVKRRIPFAQVILVAVTTTSLMSPAAAIPGSPRSRAAFAEEIYPVPSSGSWSGVGHGWGHGRGLSQWGAQGAALQGQSTDAILSFYYAGTSPTAVGDPDIRVQLTAYAGNVIVLGPYGSEVLTVTDLATGATTTLPSAARYEVIVHPSSMEVAQLTPDGWWPIAQMVGPVEFRGPSGTWAYNPNMSGAGRQYWGRLRVVRTGTTTAQAVNVVDLQSYLRGAVPRESPAWFAAAALRAQAVAARTYALSVSQASKPWDICDSTQCQVYGGRILAEPGKSLQYLESASTSEAVAATSGLALYYGGAPAFTEYSSSNGGWSTDGGRPYLRAQADPYSGTAPGDSVSNWTDTLPVSRVQAYCPSGGQLRQLVVTGRDGRGDLGGRITSLRVECTTGSRTLTSLTDLRLGMRSHWWKLSGVVGLPFGQLDTVKAIPDGIFLNGWALDPDTTASTYVWIDIDGHGFPLGTPFPRQDIADAYPGYGPYHGYQAAIPAAPGTHRVCAIAINDAAGGDSPLGCKDVTVGASVPIGSLDEARAIPGGIFLSGWALDPDTTASTYVWINIDGHGFPLGTPFARQDIAEAYLGYGPYHGYQAAIPAAPGTHRVCAIAINDRPGPDRAIGCVVVGVVS